MTFRVLIGCESSGIVRDAFNEKPGVEAWSCDLLPSDTPTNRHIIGDIRDHLHDGWDFLAVFHPPCTRLCNSGVRWLIEPPSKLSGSNYTLDQRMAYLAMSVDERRAFMWAELDRGCALFSDLWNAPIKYKAVENPVMHKHAKQRIRNYREASQTVQPWWFGDPVFKATGLYLDGLPDLVPTNKLTPPKSGTAEHKEWSKIHRASPGPDRWKQRSKFFPGIARAMADQWYAHAIGENRIQYDLFAA
ncbi:hypothetical protein ACTU44_21905 (plasmid) [Thalassospira sp. SM2505]